MIIYKATNAQTGECYIGQTTCRLSQRKCEHHYDAFKRLRDDKFHSALREYGREAFIWEVLAQGGNNSMLCRMERNYIILNNSIDKGYNTQVRNDKKIKKAVSKNG